MRLDTTDTLLTALISSSHSHVSWMCCMLMFASFNLKRESLDLLTMNHSKPQTGSYQLIRASLPQKTRRTVPEVFLLAFRGSIPSGLGTLGLEINTSYRRRNHWATLDSGASPASLVTRRELP